MMTEIFIVSGIVAVVLGIFLWMIQDSECQHPQRKTFCCGTLAFVVCTTCGAESIPWQVSKQKADNWLEVNPDYMKELLDIKANAKTYWSKR